MAVPDNPKDAEEWLERVRRAEAATKRAGRPLAAVLVVVFIVWLYFLWSCRGGCSLADWMFIAAYPALVVLYLIEVRRTERRMRSEMPEYQQALAVLEKEKERDRDQSQ